RRHEEPSLAAAEAKWKDRMADQLVAAEARAKTKLARGRGDRKDGPASVDAIEAAVASRLKAEFATEMRKAEEGWKTAEAQRLAEAQARWQAAEAARMADAQARQRKEGDKRTGSTADADAEAKIAQRLAAAEARWKEAQAANEAKWEAAAKRRIAEAEKRLLDLQGAKENAAGDRLTELQERLAGAQADLAAQA